jgi:hypothetical protein
MENFGFALLPKIPSDLPLPVTRRRLARFSISANERLGQAHPL